MRIAYLTSAYARASDSFIRGEVLALRALGHTVDTYSVRRSPLAERVTDEIRREDSTTTYILEQPPTVLVREAVSEALARPWLFLKAVRMALSLRTPGIRGHLLPMAYLIEACWLAARLRAARTEHLHDHIAEGSAAVAMIAAGLAELPFSFTVHGPGEFDRAPTLRFDLKVRHAAFVAAITEFARSQVLRWCEAGDWEKVRVVRCGVAPDFFMVDAPPPGDDARLVFVGRLDPVKGVPLLVRAVIDLISRWPSLRVVLIGDGPARPQIEEDIRRSGGEAHFELRGWAGPSEIRDEILAARVLVLPSFAEGLPVVLMEAMALHRPVVATAVGGISELVEPGINGWLIAPGSVQELAATLVEVLTADADTVSRMGNAAASAVRARHDRIREAQRLAALFESFAAVDRGRMSPIVPMN